MATLNPLKMDDIVISHDKKFQMKIIHRLNVYYYCQFLASVNI